MVAFLSMGGYAAFVWPAFAVAALVMVGLLMTSLRGLRSNQAALDALEQDIAPRRRRPRQKGSNHDA